MCVCVSQAEAQCAWLDTEGLVDGVVTDDNDVFLFGGQHVYRNIFDNKRCDTHTHTHTDTHTPVTTAHRPCWCVWGV